MNPFFGCNIGDFCSGIGWLDYVTSENLQVKKQLLCSITVFIFETRIASTLESESTRGGVKPSEKTPRV